MSRLSPGIITRWSKGSLRRHLNIVNAQLELSSTIDAAFDEIIASMSNSAQDHIKFADTLTTQTIEILKILEKKNEEVKKKACPQSPYRSLSFSPNTLTGNAVLPEVALWPGPLIYRAPQGQEKLNSSLDFVLRMWRVCRVNKRSDGDYRAHCEADRAIFVQYDEDCAEVESFRQKQAGLHLIFLCISIT